MLAKPLRTTRKRASAERCVRPLGAMIAMATPIVKSSERSSEGRMFASRFTKRQVRYRGGYEVLSTSGNCCYGMVILSDGDDTSSRTTLTMVEARLRPQETDAHGLQIHTIC